MAISRKQAQRLLTADNVTSPREYEGIEHYRVSEKAGNALEPAARLLRF